MDSRAAQGHQGAMRDLDAPPVWLLLHMAAAWALARLDPWDLSLGDAGVLGLAAGLLMGGGLLLILVAVAQMKRHRTPVLPRREALQLMTTGVFRRSRHPIYLGMTLILLGWALRLGDPLALIAVPVFLRVIERRFVEPEEAALARRFGTAYGRYARATRRWL